MRDWGRTWALALALAALFLSGWELSWRRRGFPPFPAADYYGLWALARQSVSPESVILLGTSRMETAVDPDLLRAKLSGAEVVQLALSASSPLPIFDHLAEDETFRGLTVVDIIPRIVFDATASRESRAREALARLGRTRSPAERMQARLALWPNSTLAARNPALGLPSLLRGWWRSGPPSPPTQVSLANRQLLLTFSPDEARRAYEKVLSIVESEGRPATQEESRGILERLRRGVERIRARGGDVVFVQLPSDGGIATVEERRYPRHRYWESLAFTGARLVHYSDHPELSGFECPDGSHLESSQVAAFTRGLARVVKTVAPRAAFGPSS